MASLPPYGRAPQVRASNSNATPDSTPNTGDTRIPSIVDRFRKNLVVNQLRSNSTKKTDRGLTELSGIVQTKKADFEKLLPKKDDSEGKNTNFKGALSKGDLFPPKPIITHPGSIKGKEHAISADELKHETPVNGNGHLPTGEGQEPVKEQEGTTSHEGSYHVNFNESAASIPAPLLPPPSGPTPSPPLLSNPASPPLIESIERTPVDEDITARIKRREYESSLIRKEPTTKIIAIKWLKVLAEIVGEKDTQKVAEKDPQKVAETDLQPEGEKKPEKLKRKGDYYLGMKYSDTKRMVSSPDVWKCFQWKPISSVTSNEKEDVATKSDEKKKKHPKLNEAEKADFKKALEHVFDIFQKANDHSIRVVEDPEQSGGKISLVMLLDKILKRKWGQKILKKKGRIQKSYISLVYHIQCDQPHEVVRQHKEFLNANREDTSKLIALLSKLQARTIAEHFSNVVKLGAPLSHLPAVLSTAVAKNETEEARKLREAEEVKRAQEAQVRKEKILVHVSPRRADTMRAAVSPRIREMTEKTQKKIQQGAENYQASVKVFKHAKKQAKEGNAAPRLEVPSLQEERLVEQLGLQYLYYECKEDQQPNVIARVLSHPDVLLVVPSDGGEPVEARKVFEEFEGGIDTYLAFHKAWLDSDRNLLKFIDDAGIKGDKAVKAKQAYEEGDFAESLRRTFQLGTMNLIFRNVMRDLFKLGLTKLSQLKLAKAEKIVSVEEKEAYVNQVKKQMGKLRARCEEAISSDATILPDLDKTSIFLKKIIKELEKEDFV